MKNVIWMKKPKALFIGYSILMVTLFGLLLTGCNESGVDSSGSGGATTKTYKSKFLPAKIMAEMPDSLKNNKTNSSTEPDRSKSLVERTAMRKNVKKRAKSVAATDCDSGGYEILKSMISEAEIFKAEVEFELMIIDSMFAQAKAYVAENGNPVPAGKLSSEFTVEMKNKLLEQFSKDLYGEEFVTLVSNALNGVIGKKISNPKITITEDPKDTNADGYHFVATYGEIDIIDLETIIEDAWDKIFDAYTLWENDDIDFEDDDFEEYAQKGKEEPAFSYTTSVMWSSDQSKVSIDRKETGSYSFTDENDNTVKSTFTYTENCKFDSASGTTTFSAGDKDSFAEYTYSFTAKTADDGSARITADDTFKCNEDKYEASWKMEIIATKSGGQMLEIFKSKDPANNNETDYFSFKETFNSQGKIIELFYKETEDGEWQKTDCDDLDDWMEEDWDDEEMPDDTVPVKVTGITEKDISFVIVPADIKGPGENGFDRETFEIGITGIGYISEDGETEVFFWGKKESLTNPGVKVYKETFDETDDTSLIKFTLLHKAAIAVSE